MNETKKKYSDFLHPDGSSWFDLNDQAEKYYNYYIRKSLGGNDAIHKITYDNCKRKKGNNN